MISAFRHIGVEYTYMCASCVQNSQFNNVKDIVIYVKTRKNGITFIKYVLKFQ